MKRLTALPIVLLVCGCASERPVSSRSDVPLSTPGQIMANFARELTSMAERYPELTGFPDDYESLPDTLRIQFRSGMRPVKTKRYLRPDDFEGHGICLQFDLCDEALPSTPTANATIRHFGSLHLQLYAAVDLSASSSPGLREELQILFDNHIAQLEKLNKTAANKAVEATTDAVPHFCRSPSERRY